MPESYSVEAVLSAKDSNFTSTFTQGEKTASSFGSAIGKGLQTAGKVGVVAIAAVGTATVAAGKSIWNLASDTAKYGDHVDKMSQKIGISADSYQKWDYVMQRAGTSIDSMKMGMKTLSKQAVKGSDSFKKLGISQEQLKNMNQEQLFAATIKGLSGMEEGTERAALASELLGRAGSDLGPLLNEGTDAIQEQMKMAEKYGMVMSDDAVKASADFEDALTTLKMAGDGLKNKLGASVLPFITKGIYALSDAFATLHNYVDAGMEGFKRVTGVGTALKDAFSEVAKELFGVDSAFGSKDSIKSFADACEKAAEKVKDFAKWLKDHAKTVAKVIKLMPKLIAAFLGLKILSSIAPILSLVGGAFAKIAKGVGGAVASKVSKTGTAVQGAGKASASSSTGLLTAAKAFALMGLAVLEIAIAFAILAQSAIALAGAGGAAIAVFFGMVAAVGALMGVMTLLAKSMSTINPATLSQISLAFLAMGVAILLVAAGFALLAFSAIALTNAGGPAIAVFFGMVVAIAALAAVFALLGPALTAGAVGFIAFGAAILMVGIGIALASAGLALLATQLPTIAAFGTAAAVGILALGAALMVFGAGALVAGAGVLVLAAALLVFAVAMAAAALGCAALAIAVGLLGVAFTVAMVAAAAGILVCVAALKLMQSSLTTIASKAKSANKSIISMKDGMNIVNQGLTAIGQKAGQITQTIISAFKRAGTSLSEVATQMTNAMQRFATAAIQAGTQAGTGFSMGIVTGMQGAASAVMSMLTSIISAMRGGYAGAYSAGAYIGQGLANGMRSMLGTVRSIAAQLAASANEAIAAKAKIGSPSKVTTYFGEMVGQGFINGMDSMAQGASRAASGLFDPSVSMPQYAYAGGLNSDYSYNTRSTIVVPVEIDGREFARVTAPYNIAENNKAQARANRAKGWR